MTHHSPYPINMLGLGNYWNCENGSS